MPEETPFENCFSKDILRSAKESISVMIGMDCLKTVC